MGRLTRQLLIIFCLVLSGAAGAQVIQNSATGELNGLSLDVSQATVNLNRAALVDAGNSSVVVNPTAVTADGAAFATVTVTLRDANGVPIEGRVVSIASNRGASDIVTQPLNPTDVNGVTTGEIRSNLVGVAEVIATDIVDNVVLDDQPDVFFTQGDVLLLTKSVRPNRATIGDVVTYTVEIQNTTAAVVSNVRIADKAAPVLSYVAGSARLDGVAIADPTPAATFLFDIGNVPALADSNANGVADPGEGGYLRLTYAMVVGAGARIGAYDNVATAIDLCDICTISQPATAQLEITSDPVFDLGTVIGKVFHDKDGDGWQDPGEAGIGGAMVALDSGVYALTDAHGRYHFPAIEPGQRLVKLNVAELSGNAYATKKDRQVLSVSPGLLAKANFGVNYTFETSAIGRDGEYGVKIDAQGKSLPDKVVGSVGDLSLVINGAEVAIPGIEVDLSNLDASAILSIGEDGKIEPLNFNIDASEFATNVDRWFLRIWREADDATKVLSGRDALPTVVQWQDIDEIRQWLLPGRVYTYQLEVQRGKTVTSSARHMFGVNRTTAISLDLRGGAFLVNSSTLTVEAKELLADAAVPMREHPDEIIRIYGHTDSSGSSEHNQNLSEARAGAAFEYLISDLGLPADRFIVQGFGEDRPVANNATEVGRSINRRVEIFGELKEIERTGLYSTRTNEASATINGVNVSLGSRDQFRTILDSGDSAVVKVSLLDALGRSIQADVALPRIELIAQEQGELLAFADDDPRLRDADAEVENVLYPYRLVGQTDAANIVTIDGAPLTVDADGRFESHVRLQTGENRYVLSSRNPQGLVRYANLLLHVHTREDGIPILVVPPIPKLVLQLPPANVQLRSGNLVVPGFTEPGNSVTFNDADVAVDDSGRFVARVSLQPGRNVVTARVTDSHGFTGELQREFDLTNSSMFVMALADAKISQLTREGNLEAAGADRRKETKTEGRVALYLKGTVLGKYLITAAFDTGESEFDQLFSDLGEIENERLITNLDPDTIYPVYGDDSSLVYDSDTQGKLYLALEGEQLDTVVGNYALNFNDAELASYQRTLYGVHADYQSSSKTSEGDSKTEAEVFVAQVEQVPVRDEILATGGSLYFLSHTDIVEGSEQVSLLIHDQHTGLLLQRITQQRDADYDVKYREGRIWFRRPISSVIDDGTLITSNPLGGNPITIQVDYETPVTNLEASVSGVRLRQRFADGRLTLGGAHIEDERASSFYNLNGVDAELNLGSTRFVAEYARSEGSDSQTFRSSDGGVQFTPFAATPMQQGTAYKFGVEFDAGDWFGEPGRLLGNAYYKRLSAGFVSNGNFSAAGDRQVGAALTYKWDNRNTILFRFDDQQTGQALSSTQTSLHWTHQRDKLGLEAEYQDRRISGATLNGSAAAVRASYQFSRRLTAALEHQQTVSGEINSQSAATLEYALLERLRLLGRFAVGPDGEALQGGATWDTPYGRLYAQQTAPPQVSPSMSETTVAGIEAPVGAGGTVYTEYQWDHGGRGDAIRSLTGIRRDWRVTDGLSLLLSGEKTTQQASAISGSEQAAVIGGVSFDRNGVKFSTRNELRRQRGITEIDQFASFNYGEVKISPAFTFLGEYRVSETDDRLQPDQSTNFAEASLGFALRPIENDRWNVLFKLARLKSEATPAQIDTRYDDSISNLVSADWSLQLSPRIEWVGKQALKVKTTQLEQLADIETNTSLSIQRLNFDLPWKLTFGGEFRQLTQQEADDARAGWLGELMWNRLDHVGLGVGYNFTDFSSDLRFDNDYSEGGWFLRIQGTY